MGRAAKSPERACETRAAPTQVRAATLRSSASAPQGALGIAAIQKAAGNLAIQRKCECGGSSGGCAECSEERRGDLQARGATGLLRDASLGIQSVLRSRGDSFDNSTQGFFESRFGRRFDNIRVHTDGQAQESARAIQAQAYTAGEHMVFAAGQYAPHTEQGKRLIAHELTHTIQQGGDASTSRTLQMHSAGMVIGHPNDLLEDEADVAANRVLDDAPVSLSGRVFGAAHVQAKFDPNAPVADFDVPDPNAPVVHHAEPAAPAPDAPPRQPLEMTFKGYLLTNSPADLRAFVEDLTMHYGRGAGYRFLDLLERPLPMRPQSDDPRVIFIQQLRAVVDERETEYEHFLKSFEWNAYLQMLDILHQSSLTVTRERQRYGLNQFSPFGLPADDSVSRAAIVEVSEAAKLLMIKKEELWPVWMDFEFPGGAHGEPTGNLQAAFDRYMAVRHQYESLHGYLTTLYPILGRIGELDASFFLSTWKSLKTEDALYKLANGDAIRQFIVLRDEADKRMSDIIETGEGLDKDRGRIWKLPPMIESTSRVMKVVEGSLNEKLIKGEIERQQAEAFWTKIALGVIQLFGALLAPFTGGLSLFVSIGIGISQAQQDWEDYQFEKAASGTDFDRARSVSRSDPSLFGLAMDIVGVVFDVAGLGAEVRGLTAASKLAAAQKALLLRAEQAFSELAPLVREAESAGGKLAAETEQSILNAARKLDPTEAFGTRLVEQLKIGKEVGGEVIERMSGLTAGQLKPLAEARAVLRQSFESEELAADAIASAQNIHINPKGWIFVCHSPCTILREIYGDLIAADPVLFARVEKLENRAAQAAENLDIATKAKNQKAIQSAQHESYEVARDANILEGELSGFATARRADVLGEIKNLRTLLEQSAVGPYAKNIVRELDTSAMERIMAAARGKDPTNAISGQLFEEIMNLKVRELRAASNLPLEFIPGWAIRGPRGELLTDGIVGMWVNGRFKILTIYEAKASAGAAEGLIGRSTGYIKPERRLKLFEIAKKKGIGDALFKENRQYTELLREAASKVRVMRRARISLDEVVKQFPDDVWEIAETTSQVEAGQFRSTAERLMASPEISAYGQKISIDFSADVARFEGVVPSNVTAAEITSLKKGAEKIGFPTASFTQLGITEDEVRAMAKWIAAARKTAAVTP